MVNYIEFAIYAVLGMLAYGVFIFILVNLFMNNAEYKHLHGYQDVREKAEEEFDKMAHEKFLELIKNKDMVVEAMGEIQYDGEFIHTLMILMQAKDYQALGEEMTRQIEKYLSGIADELTTDGV